MKVILPNPPGGGR